MHVKKENYSFQICFNINPCKDIENKCIPLIRIWFCFLKEKMYFGYKNIMYYKTFIIHRSERLGEPCHHHISACREHHRAYCRQSSLKSTSMPTPHLSNRHRSRNQQKILAFLVKCKVGDIVYIPCFRNCPALYLGFLVCRSILFCLEKQ